MLVYLQALANIYLFGSKSTQIRSFVILGEKVKPDFIANSILFTQICFHDLHKLQFFR